MLTMRAAATRTTKSGSPSAARTPPALDRVVKTCLAKEPDERWQSARDLKRELQWIVEGGQPPQPAAGRRERLPHWAWKAATALLLVVALHLDRRSAESESVNYQAGLFGGFFVWLPELYGLRTIRFEFARTFPSKKTA